MLNIKINDELELAYLTLGKEPPQKIAYVIHGIMGSKKNLYNFVKKLAENCPDWGFYLFDLRNHGESSKHCEPFDLNTIANDLLIASAQLNINPQAIIGHSFGAKVALLAAQKIASISSLWLLDSSPGIIKAKSLTSLEKFTALEIIDILKKISWPVKKRLDLIDQLLAYGVEKNIALWMTTNLMPVENGFKLIFYPDEIKKMLLDFLSTDLWGIVANLATRIDIHLVAAEHSGRLELEEERQLLGLAPERGFFHILKNSGHFVHIDNPADLIKIFGRYLH